MRKNYKLKQFKQFKELESPWRFIHFLPVFLFSSFFFPNSHKIGSKGWFSYFYISPTVFSWQKKNKLCFIVILYIGCLLLDFFMYQFAFFSLFVESWEIPWYHWKCLKNSLENEQKTDLLIHLHFLFNLEWKIIEILLSIFSQFSILC